METKTQLKELDDWVSKLGDRDTEKQAFVALAGAITQLPANLVQPLFLRMERPLDPNMMSTRENIVLLIEILCKAQPVGCAALKRRITKYLMHRLRDKRAKVTEACVGASSALALHVLPLLPALDVDKMLDLFWKEANVHNDGAARCVGALLHPVTTDTDALAAHAERVRPYLITFLPLVVTRFHSKVYASYSSTFHVLHRIALLVKEVPGTMDVAAALAEHMPTIVSAVQDVLVAGTRDDWLNRKRGLDLLHGLLVAFPHHRATTDLKDQIMRIADRGRSDYASPVRESAVALVAHLGPLPRTSGLGAAATDATYAALHPPRASSPEPRGSQWRTQSPTQRSPVTSPRATRVGTPYVQQLAPVGSSNQTSQEFADNVRLAMEEGDIELALRIALVSEDSGLLGKVLAFAQPSVQFFKSTTLNALCAAFLDFRFVPEKAPMTFPWISCLLMHDGLVQSVDPRILKELEAMLYELTVLTGKDGLNAARLHDTLASRPTV
ncbi:hypothetical protein ACHHYP_09635 [Achlya hypogyna]|uniref:TORTIFOLIA1/SINE1-2 N-terminal domain-containing protein n=1 Tax=Achlya hypogyna TaxID=1202772 RepID=A0A1V9YMS2_ACHHY|nr:hypothetical protein ACHHYP_09635 [Achlya hypogyna]